MFQSQHKVKGRSFSISVRNSPKIHWTFCRYGNISVLRRLRVFVLALMSILFIWRFGNFAFLNEMRFCLLFLTSLAVTETFSILSNLPSHGAGRYVKLLPRCIKRNFSRSMQRFRMGLTPGILCSIFQDWKVQEKGCWAWKVLEIC